MLWQMSRTQGCMCSFCGSLASKCRSDMIRLLGGKVFIIFGAFFRERGTLEEGATFVWSVSSGFPLLFQIRDSARQMFVQFLTTIRNMSWCRDQCNRWWLEKAFNKFSLETYRPSFDFRLPRENLMRIDTCHGQFLASWPGYFGSA